MLVVGVPLIRYVPINALRVVVGALLLVLGLSWLRKAILRASGHKALHDEDAIFAETSADSDRLAELGRRGVTPQHLPSHSRACSSRGPKWC